MRQVIDVLMVLVTAAAACVFLLLQTPAAEFETSRELNDFLASRRTSRTSTPFSRIIRSTTRRSPSSLAASIAV
jgi:hypothetical protein